MEKKVIAVTGANTGLGFSLVKELCRSFKDDIIFLTAPDEKKGREAVKKLTGSGCKVLFHILDVTSEKVYLILQSICLKHTEGLIFFSITQQPEFFLIFHKLTRQIILLILIIWEQPESSKISNHF